MTQNRVFLVKDGRRCASLTSAKPSFLSFLMNFSIIEDYCFGWLSQDRKIAKIWASCHNAGSENPFRSTDEILLVDRRFIDIAVNLKSWCFWKFNYFCGLNVLFVYYKKNIEPFSLNIYHLFWMKSVLTSPKFYSDKYVGKTFLISYFSEAFHCYPRYTQHF